MISEGYIVSLVKLLDDEDASVSKIAYEKLLNLGSNALPMLLKIKDVASDKAKSLLLEIVDVIRYRKYVDDVISFFAAPEKDIEKGSFLVAKFAYSEVNFKHYSEILDLMAVELRKRIYTKENFYDIVETVNKFFFVEQGFRGNMENYYDIDNALINRVIDRRLGIPITLSLIYILVGKRVNLPVYGIAMPGHFIVRYESNGFEIYVDPFDSGRIMTRAECEKFVSQIGYSEKDIYFKRATPELFVKLMFENLALAYKSNGYIANAQRLIEIIKLIENFR
ncbi:MAG: transglutaminase-like domain-containing protein [Candidatus Kryptonium sp.]|nr:transglutaminase-like domain-containing protein [Candidatus Kryptonium sp.]